MRFHRHVLALLVALITISTLQPVRYAAAGEAASVPPMFPCYSGSVPPSGAFCLIIPLKRADGGRADGIPVEASLNGRTVRALSQQLVNEPAGTAAAVLPVNEIGVWPGALMEVSVLAPGQRNDRLIGFRPNRRTFMQTLPPLIIGAQPPLSAPIWGQVWVLNSDDPLEKQEVRLFRGTEQLGVSTTKSRAPGQPPLFAFTPSTPLQNGQVLRLETTYRYEDQPVTYEVTFLWKYGQIEIQFVIGNPCNGQIPRGGDGTSMPSEYCLSVSAYDGDTPVQGASVFVIIGEKALEPHITKQIAGLHPVAAALDIGPMLDEADADTVVRVIAVHNPKIGIYTAKTGDFDQVHEWAKHIRIDLQADVSPGADLIGGSPTVVAAAHGAVYLGSPGGLAVRHQNQAFWTRVLGENPLTLPTPEISALTLVGASGTKDGLVAGLNSGAVLFSVDSGATWSELLKPNGRPVRGFAATLAALVVIRGQERLTFPWSLPAAGGTSTLPVFSNGQPTVEALPFVPTALAALADNRLIAGASDGLYLYESSVWKRVPNLNLDVTALAAIWPGSSERVLIGSAQGLWLADTSGISQALDLAGPIYNLTSTAQSKAGPWEVFATTPQGLFQATISSVNDQPEFEWKAGADGITSGASTTGMPDVLDLASTSTDVILAATSSGVFTSSDQGLNWGELWTPPDLTPVRSVAVLGGDGVLALTAQSLWVSQALRGPWRQITGLPGDLNGVIIRAVDGVWLLGRAAGPGETLLVSRDGGASWSSRGLGENRGVTAMAALDPSSRMRLVIGTDGDGVYGWVPGASEELQRLPDLNDQTGRPARISSLAVVRTNQGACRIVAGSLGADASVAFRPCDTSSAWEPAIRLDLDGRNVGAVTALLQLGSQERYLAATAAGFLLFTLDRSLGQAPFSTALRAQTLMLPDDYNEKRQFLAGGTQSGALLFSDLAPDLAVSIAVPPDVKGNTTFTTVITFTNQGLLPTTQTSYSVEVQNAQAKVIPTDPQLMQGAVPALSAGQALTVPLTFLVDRDIQPALASVKVSTAAQEQFNANNSSVASVNLLYRDGPDPRPGITVQSSLKSGEQSVLRLLAYNSGNLASGPLTVTATLPPELSVITPPPASIKIQGGKLIWTLQPLEKEARVAVPISFKLSSAVAPTDLFTVSVRLETSGDDREPDNNDELAIVGVRTATPLGIIVTHFPRLSAQNGGQASALRLPLQQIAQRENLLVLDLGNAPLCGSPGSTSGDLDCLYRTWDEATGQLASAVTSQQPITITQSLLNQALNARSKLTAAIAVKIGEAAKGITAGRYLYLVGGDSVIPAGALPDISSAQETVNQGTVPERVQTEDLGNPKDSLYAVFRDNAYPSYQPYQTIAGVRFKVGVQAGTAEDILAVLRTFVQNGGTLDLTHRNISGYAEKLTMDTQTWLCQQLQQQNFAPTEACGPISPSVKTGLALLGKGSTLTVLSGHARAWDIGDLTSRQIAQTSLSNLNLLLLLGCHSGLVPDQRLAQNPALMAVLGRKGQPAFGFTGYAYAQLDEHNTDPLYGAYAEQLARDLVTMLNQSKGTTSGDPNGFTLGALMEATIAEYNANSAADDLAGLHRKTMSTFTLYGPPMYRVRTPAGGSEPVALRTDQPVTEQVTVQTTFSPRQLPVGTVYTAVVDNGQSRPLIEMSRSLQYGFTLTVPSGITSAVIAGGSYHDITGVDPVIPRIAPLQTALLYYEPAPVFQDFDWRDPPQVRLDGRGNPVLLMPLGSWQQRTATQRLTDRVTLRLIRPSDPNAGPPSLTDQPTLCLLGHEVSITIDNGANIDQVEVVVLNNGSLEVFPLRLTGKTWRAKVAIPEGRQLYLQAIGKNGSVIYLNNNGNNYIAPGKVTPCRPN